MVVVYGSAALLYGDDISSSIQRPEQPGLETTNWWSGIPVLGGVIDSTVNILGTIWQGLGFLWVLITFSIPHLPDYIANVFRILMFPLWVGVFYVILTLIRGGG